MVEADSGVGEDAIGGVDADGSGAVQDGIGEASGATSSASAEGGAGDVFVTDDAADASQLEAAAASVTIADFDALQYAIDNSADGYVALDADVSWEGAALVVAEGRTVTLDLNGHSLTRTDEADRDTDEADDEWWCTLNVYGSLTVVGDGSVTGPSEGGDHYVAAVRCAKGGTVELLGGSYFSPGGVWDLC